ncbi:MAG: ABC transporter permease, partial [Phycisphaerales bacterium]|nr:ABC transporter permease [Phycisphaerales bacterium]
MHRYTVPMRSLVYYWRAHVAVALAVVAATAALTGALLVGDSVRGSLRELAVSRLCGVTHALISTRFVRESLAGELDGRTANRTSDERGIGSPPGRAGDPANESNRRPATDAAAPPAGVRATPIILLPGGVTHAQTQALVGRVNVLGVDGRFWEIGGAAVVSALPTNADRYAIVNQALADALGAVPGDHILVRIGKPSDIPTETLLGRKDDVTSSMRLPIHSVLPNAGIGQFSLQSSQAAPYNVYVPLSELQRALRKQGRVNAILVTTHGTSIDDGSIDAKLRHHLSLQDVGLTVRVDRERRYLALESDRFLIEPPLEATVRTAVKATETPTGIQRDTVSDDATTEILAYLAKRITVGDPNQTRSIPYSTIAAIAGDPPLNLGDGRRAPPLQFGEIYLNRWTADELHAEIGGAVTLDYDVSTPAGGTTTKSTSFRLAGVVDMDAHGADPGFVPEYPGVTDTDDMADWNPPFPIDLSTVSPRDEDYWDRYRAAPKAFVALEQGQSMWASETDRFGRLTSIRIHPSVSADLDAVAATFNRALLDEIDPSAIGLRFRPVRDEALAAGRGSTDFAGLFIGFSFFLIVAAAMLIALLFRLGVERRGRQLGLMRSVGFRPATLAWSLILEGSIVAIVGAIAGSAAAVAYGGLMLVGLRTWWNDAVRTTSLQLHASATSIAAGFIVAVVIAVVSIAWSVRGLARRSPRALSAGDTDHASPTIKQSRKSVAVAVAALIVAGGLFLASRAAWTTEAPTFFGVGAAILVAGLAFVRAAISATPRRSISRSGPSSIARLGIRNARRAPGRSMMTIGLIASASFVVSALQAFRLQTDETATDISSPSGGFTLFAESAAPLLYDLNSAAGREKLNIVDDSVRDALAGATVVPFRLRPGDEASCLNLYVRTHPRFIGATPPMIARGGFDFSATLADSDAERRNPWTLLDRTFPDGAIPAIGDEAAVKWQLHSGLGDDFTTTDDAGTTRTLRFVALFKGSALQDELIVSESQFLQLFPSTNGFRFFLMETPADRDVQQLAVGLERELAPFSFDVGTIRDRLTAYAAVQNTYLSTFQSLGGLGLVLGTVGLGAVMARNVFERRGELALMRAVGFRTRTIAFMVFAENATLVIAGLFLGVVSALVAVAPHLRDRPGTFPWASTGLIVLAVLVVGLLSGAAAFKHVAGHD